MSLKQITAVTVLLVLLTAGLGALLAQPQKQAAPLAPEPFGFWISMQDYGSLNSGSGVRDYLTLYVNTSGTDNFSIRMITLGSEPRGEVYEVNDYPYSEGKQSVMAVLRKDLSAYGMEVIAVPLYEAEQKKGAVIILPSDAIPDRLSGPEFAALIDGNAVIFFGKHLDIAMEQSGSQKQVGSNAYAALNLSPNLAPSSDLPHVAKNGSVTRLEYGNGWLVLYPDSENETLGSELASLIVDEGWQTERDEAKLTPEILGNRSTVTIFSGSLRPKTYYGRVVYAASGMNKSLVKIMDLANAEKPYGTLSISDKTNQGAGVAYSFELHDNFTYPVSYDFRLRFVKDGRTMGIAAAKTVTLKTFATESGTVSPNMTSGDYIVQLVDQEGLVHAAAYTHVPELKVRLVRIEGSEHIFLIMLDGRSAELAKALLTVDENGSFRVTTAENGEVRVPLLLQPGLHSFTVELEGEKATTYYRKEMDESGFMLYAVIGAGGAFIVAAAVLNARVRRKWAIHTYRRPAPTAKVLRIPYATFIRLFVMTREHRAPGMPLSVSDLRIGMRKHATYRGAPLFLTDSNIYNVLDSLARKGRMLSYGGYFLPAEMAGDKPIEYWVVKRKLSDHLLENGEELRPAKKGGFLVHGKTFHIWPDIYPKLVRRAPDSVIIFPDEELKAQFFRLAQKYDPLWMELSLELQYGGMHFLTIHEFIERGLHGKG